MTGRTELKPLFEELDRRADLGDPLQLWLRDDDAVAPSEPLDRLLQLTNHHGVPTLLAVIPAFTGTELQQRLALEKGVEVAVHGWAHLNHAGAGEKSRELGMHRPLATVLDELARGRERLESLYETRFVPMLVPPWNRIDPAHAALLPDLGFRGISCFRGYRLGAKGGPALVNTALDIMDWRVRIGRPAADLVDEACRLLAGLRAEAGDGAALGLLLHHRDHDEAAWAFLEGFLARATAHPAVVHGDPRRLFGL